METAKCALCDKEAKSLVWLHDDENGGAYYICDECRDNKETYHDYLYFLSLLRAKRVIGRAKKTPQSE